MGMDLRNRFDYKKVIKAGEFTFRIPIFVNDSVLEILRNINSWDVDVYSQDRGEGQLIFISIEDSEKLREECLSYIGTNFKEFFDDEGKDATYFKKMLIYKIMKAYNNFKDMDHTEIEFLYN